MCPACPLTPRCAPELTDSSIPGVLSLRPAPSPKVLVSERGVVCPIVGTVIPTGTESPMPRRTIFHGMVCVRSPTDEERDAADA